MALLTPSQTWLPICPFQCASLRPYECPVLSLGEPMRRREFITLIGGAAAWWPLATSAQQAKVPRIGYLATGSLESPDARLFLDAFRQGLHERGYLEGQNIVIEFRAANGEIERFPALASELVRLKVDVIVVPNTPAARAVLQATTTIPVVVPVMGDPVRDGLVASLARPGGNITGLTFLGPELVPPAQASAPHGFPGGGPLAPRRIWRA